MKNLVLLTCSAVTLISSTHARHGGHVGGSLYQPHRRNYDYHRRYRPNAIDLVSEMFSIPFYTSNSLFRQQQDQVARLLEQRNSSPRYSISQSEDGTVVELAMEVPGVPAKDLSVEVENRTVLRIRGSRTIRESGSSFTKTEFDQSFQLDDDIDIENMSVSLSSGILTVIAPRKQQEIRKVQLHIEEGDSLVAKMDVESIHRDDELESNQGGHNVLDDGTIPKSDDDEDFVITED